MNLTLILVIPKYHDDTIAIYKKSKRNKNLSQLSKT